MQTTVLFNRHICQPSGRLKKHMDMHMEFSIRFIGNAVNDNPQLVLVTVSQSYCELQQLTVLFTPEIMCASLLLTGNGNIMQTTAFVVSKTT
jgi:hypothetical protein